MNFDMKALQDAAYQKMREVMAQREEILTAFIAKYGFEPDEIVQVLKQHGDGTQEYFVRQKTENEVQLEALVRTQRLVNEAESNRLHRAYKNEQLGTT